MNKLLFCIVTGIGLTAFRDRYVDGYISKKVHKYNTG